AAGGGGTPATGEGAVLAEHSARRRAGEAMMHYRGKTSSMVLARSSLTAQGHLSVPAKVRRKLGLGPGAVLEWDEDGEQVVVRRAGRYSSEDVHRSVFPTPPKPKTLSELKEGVRRHMKRRRAGR